MSKSDTYALLRLHDELDELEASFRFRGLRKRVPMVVLGILVGWAFVALTPVHYRIGAWMILIPYAALLVAGPFVRLNRIRRLRQELAEIEAEANGGTEVRSSRHGPENRVDGDSP